MKEECPRVKDLVNEKYSEAFLLSAGVGLSPITEWMVDGETPGIKTTGYSDSSHHVIMPLPRSNSATSTSMKLRSLLIDRNFDMGMFKL